MVIFIEVSDSDEDNISSLSGVPPRTLSLEDDDDDLIDRAVRKYIIINRCNNFTPDILHFCLQRTPKESCAQEEKCYARYG